VKHYFINFRLIIMKFSRHKKCGAVLWDLVW
jgi:hypothetical protein